jgi:ClpP class serine protease
VCLSLDCAAGEQSYARGIVDQLDSYSRETLTPVHTFAEDLALDVGYIMLLAGQEITANPFASIGDIAKSKKVDVLTNLMGKMNMVLQSHLPASK